MRFLCVKQPVRANIFGEEFELKPLDADAENLEDILVMDNFAASELITRHGDHILEATFNHGKPKGFPKTLDKLSDIEPESNILIIRNGGIGDHILFLPAIRAYREMLPRKSKIWLSVQKDKHPIYYNNKHIERLYPLPLGLDILVKADYLIEFSEKDDMEDFKSLHMSDYYLNFMKIDYMNIKNKQPKINWDNKRSSRITSLFEDVKKRNLDKPLFLLNWKSSNRLRDIPPEKLLFLTEIFKKDIMFVVAQESNLSKAVNKLIGNSRKNVFNCTSKMDSLEDYISAIANCDAVITTDTATGHLAEALGKPSLVIYGPTIDDHWIRYYKNTYPLRAEYSGTTCCSPCGLTKNTDEGCPEAVLLGTPYSPCLFNINQERICSKFSQILTHVMSNKGFGL